MDIKSFWAKLSVFWEKAAAFSNTAFEKAGKFTGDMLEKTADFTYDKLKASSYCLANGEAYDQVKGHKNLVVFVVSDRENPQSKAIIWRMPIQIGKAWQYSATLKLMYAQDVPDLAAAIWAVPPCALIYRNGILKHMVTGEKLSLFLENFDISCDWSELAIKPAVPGEAKKETPAVPAEAVKATPPNS